MISKASNPPHTFFEMAEEHTRRHFLKTAAVVGAGLTGILASGCSPGLLSGKGGRPNIVLVTIDTQRYDRLGFNNYSRNTTPFLDTLAEIGTVFDRNYCQAPTTIPSTFSLMTSRYPGNIMLDYASKIPGTIKTLADILQEEGYQTFGAVSVIHLNRGRNFNKGFSYYSEVKTDKQKSHGFIRSGDKTVEALLSALKENYDAGRPLFVWVHLFEPHFPYSAPDEYTNKFTSGGKARFSDLYDGQVLFADHNVKKLFDALSGQNILDLQRDLFILTSDHGELLGEHGYISHHGGYEEVLHVPMMLTGAGLPKGKRIASLTMNLDLVPTIAEIVGIRNDSDEWEGKSLLYLLSHSEQELHHEIFVDLPFLEGYVIRTGHHKFVKRFYPDMNREELKDPQGFFPSSVMQFDHTKGVLLNLPPIGHNKEDIDVSIRFVASRRDGLKQLLWRGILSRTDAEGDQFNLSDRVRIFSQEDYWNIASSFRKISCTITLQTKKSTGRNPKVLSKFEVDIKPAPTSKFCELYDLKTDRNENVNLYSNPAYADIIKVLGKKISEHAGSGGKKEAETNVRDLDDSELEALKALGYL